MLSDDDDTFDVAKKRMTDRVSAEVRSELMSRIRGKDTKPEYVVRRHLHSLGFRYRLHDGRLPGRPDLVLPKHRAVVFVNGCFWHRHPDCPYAYVPKSRREFWSTKFAETIRRDGLVQDELRDLGWRVFVVWECQLSAAALADLAGALRI